MARSRKISSLVTWRFFHGANSNDGSTRLPTEIPRHSRRRLGGKSLGRQEECAAGAAHRGWASGLGRGVCTGEVLGKEVGMGPSDRASKSVLEKRGRRSEMTSDFSMEIPDFKTGRSQF